MSLHALFAERRLRGEGAIDPPLRLIESAAREGSLDSFIAGLALTRFTPEVQIEGSGDREVNLVRKAAAYSRPRGQVRKIDDLRVAFFDRWWLLPGSNPQPARVVRFEGAFQQGCGAMGAIFEDKPRELGAI